MSDETNISLLKQCYEILESIEYDGWIVRGGKSTLIPKLLDRIRRALYTPIKYSESISFHCLNECGYDLKAKRDDMTWSYVHCGECDKGYRIIWGHDGIATIVIDCDEGK